MFDDILKVFIL